MRTTLTALALSLATAAIAQPMPRAANCLDRVPASAAASAPGGNTPYACRAGAGADAPTDAQIDAMLMSMQAMHDKMKNAKTTEERQALMAEHIGTVQAHLRLPASQDPLAQLRSALAPVNPPQAPAAAAKPRRKPPANDPPTDTSTYLGALL